MTDTPQDPNADENQATLISIPWLSIIRRADPNYFKDRARQIEYEFRGRDFSADPTTRGAFNDDPD